MEKENSLSSYIREEVCSNYPRMVINKDFVKEFIKKLKEEFPCSCSNMQICNDIRTCKFCLLKDKIDKLAGEKLI